MRTKPLIPLVLCAAVLLQSCAAFGNQEDAETIVIPDEIFYTEDDLARDLGFTEEFPKVNGKGISVSAKKEVESSSERADDKTRNEDEGIFRQKVFGSMEIYSSVQASKPDIILSDGEIIMLRELEGTQWAEVYYNDGPLMGYAKDAFMNAVAVNSEVYAELPIEYGMAKTDQWTEAEAYSHLVDIRKYFKVYSSTEELEGAADFSEYDLNVSMKLSTDNTSIKEPFYDSNICMVQYDLLPKIKKAVELFSKDGCVMVICDAYRPTGVHKRWFDAVKENNKWVADPSVGMGAIHDRGTALDISLVDFSGKEFTFPTPVHTLTDEASRFSTAMSSVARNNMNYVLNIMLQCGFTYNNSEWWHFEDVDTKYYLPTDHPIDMIPLVPSETGRIGTVSVN